MATDSVVQFNYSDGVPLISLYIKSDSHLEEFLPILKKAVISANETSKRRSWDYAVAEIVADIVKNKHLKSLVRICHIHYPDENCKTIYKHIISVKNEYYDNDGNELEDFVTITSKYPIGSEIIYEGLLFEFSKAEMKNN